MEAWVQDPLQKLHEKIQRATAESLPEPTAFSLATVDSEGQPRCRTVLFKGLSHGGLRFFTNYRGQKARDLLANPRVCGNFFWTPWAEQARVTGYALPLPRKENEEYFSVRPRASQIGAWASAQSEAFEKFADLEDAVRKIELRFLGQEVPCPPHWGGYVIWPFEIEFWVGREGRLHERYVYSRSQSVDLDLKAFAQAKSAWTHFFRFP